MIHSLTLIASPYRRPFRHSVVPSTFRVPPRLFWRANQSVSHVQKWCETRVTLIIPNRTKLEIPIIKILLVLSLSISL